MSEETNQQLDNPVDVAALQARVDALEVALHDLTGHVFAHSKPHEGRLRRWWDELRGKIAEESAPGE